MSDGVLNNYCYWSEHNCDVSPKDTNKIFQFVQARHIKAAASHKEQIFIALQSALCRLQSLRTENWNNITHETDSKFRLEVTFKTAVCVCQHTESRLSLFIFSFLLVFIPFSSPVSLFILLLSQYLTVLIHSHLPIRKLVSVLRTQPALLLLLLLLLLTAIELSLGGSSPYTSAYKTNKNKYT
jgi:hypothetical protein